MNTRNNLFAAMAAAAALRIAGHTAAARLLTRGLLAAHLRFCGLAAARVPVRTLAYPRNWTSHLPLGTSQTRASP